MGLSHQTLQLFQAIHDGKTLMQTSPSAGIGAVQAGLGCGHEQRADKSCRCRAQHRQDVSFPDLAQAGLNVFVSRAQRCSFCKAE